MKRIGLLAGLLLVCAGCGGSSGPALVTISGEVTFDGEAVADGEIQFTPVEGGGTDAGRIVDGLYEVDVKPGEKSVVVLGYKQDGPEFDGKPTRRQFLPPGFSQPGTLKATISKDGERTLDFHLQRN